MDSNRLGRACAGHRFLAATAHVFLASCGPVDVLFSIQIFFQDDIDSAINLKLVLYLFEAMSGLKINFEKSEVLLIELDNEKLLFYAELFTVRLESGPSNIWG
jgi:hypothetical protein